MYEDGAYNHYAVKYTTTDFDEAARFNCEVGAIAAAFVDEFNNELQQKGEEAYMMECVPLLLVRDDKEKMKNEKRFVSKVLFLRELLQGSIIMQVLLLVTMI
eukprot:UN24130